MDKKIFFNQVKKSKLKDLYVKIFVLYTDFICFIRRFQKLRKRKKKTNTCNNTYIYIFVILIM